MLKLAYIGLPRYLSIPILSAIAKEFKKYGMNYYIDTSEESPMVSVPENFDMTIRINKRLVTDVMTNMKERSILKTVSSVKKLRKHVNSRLTFLNPDAIIATSDMGGVVTRLCNEWAKRHNRPFFIMQPSFLEVAPEGIKEKMSRIFIYLAFNKILRAPIGRKQHYYGCERKENYKLIWSGEFSNQMRISDIRNTFVVGNPLLDKFATQSVNLNVKQPPVALICTQPYDKLVDMGILKNYQALDIIIMLTNIVVQNPNVHFIIKVHPSENILDYHKLFDDLIPIGNFEIVQFNESIAELLKIADVQISMASYTSFEAVVAGVPIIILHPEYVNFFDQFYGIAQNVRTMRHFNVVLHRLLRELGRGSFSMQREIYLNKKLAYFGCSAEITAKTIKKVIEWKKPGFK